MRQSTCSRFKASYWTTTYIGITQTAILHLRFLLKVEVGEISEEAQAALRVAYCSTLYYNKISLPTDRNLLTQRGERIHLQISAVCMYAQRAQF